MAWEFKDNAPIYTQLIEKIKYKIISGEYKVGEKLPSVRELAAEATVNPNTMQRALAELEKMGLIYSVRTSGRYITEDTQMINEIKEVLAKEEIKEFLNKMQKIGIKKGEIVDSLKKVIEEGEK